MKLEKFVTETEKRILDKRKTNLWEVEKVYSADTIYSSYEVSKACGYRAVLLYRALLGSYSVQREEPFKLLPVFKQAIHLSGTQLSQDTRQLERARFVTVERKPGHKNLFALTEKGRRGLVDRR